MFLKSGLLFIGLSFLFGVHREVHAATCGLNGAPDDSSPSNLFTLPPVADNMENKFQAWTATYWGFVVGISAEDTPHAKYFSAQFSTTTRTYWIAANAITKDFVKLEGTRELVRYISLRCVDGNGVESRARYYFKILFQDMERPEFAQDEYSITITKDWDLENRPISDGLFIFVSDKNNNVELEDKKKKLRFVSPEDVINSVESHPLWVLANPPRYYYRLDLYLNSETKLQAGESFQTSLSALDDYNSGVTKININVTD